jgi:hypothetical protein
VSFCSKAAAGAFTVGTSEEILDESQRVLLEYYFGRSLTSDTLR